MEEPSRARKVRCGIATISRFKLYQNLTALFFSPNFADEDGVGGDDAADCCRSPVATKARTVMPEEIEGGCE